MPKHNEKLKQTFLQVVNNQLRENNPPEANQTLIRLMQAGHSEQEATEMIVSLIVSDVYNILKNGQEFDLPSYIAALKQLS